MTWCTNVIVVQSMLTAAVTYKPHSITPNKNQLMLSTADQHQTTDKSNEPHYEDFEEKKRQDY